MLSSTYFRLRQYSNALEKAKQEVRNNCIDDGKIGAAFTIGKSLLLLGRYGEAQPYLCGLAAESHLGGKFGGHFTIAGLAFWFDDQPDRAVELWEEGLGVGFQAHEGMELPWILLYAAARRPGCYSLIRAKRLIRQKSQRLAKDTFAARITAFVLQQESYETTMQKLSSPYTRPLYRGSPSVERLLMQFRSQLEFYAGVHALLKEDTELFYQQMLACASMNGHQNCPSELLIAECEIREGPAKWKRRLANWLRQNVGDKPRRFRRTKTRRAEKPGS